MGTTIFDIDNGSYCRRKGDLATSLAVLALYDGEAEINPDQINNLLKATNNTFEAYLPILFSNFLSKPEKVMELICSPGGSGGGGGAGGAEGGDAGEEEAEKEEEKVEEEEIDFGGGMDMFGGEEGGGDY